jgi:hypothetical protein
LIQKLAISASNRAGTLAHSNGLEMLASDLSESRVREVTNKKIPNSTVINNAKAIADISQNLAVDGRWTLVTAPSSRE